MTESKVVRWALWVAVVIAPLVSAALVGLATGTTLWGLDAWNTTLNDEQTYYATVRQMRLYGTPTGVAGYNEVMAQRLSFGAYTPFVFFPFYLGSLLTGLESHNFIYTINLAFGVLAALLVVLMLKPSVKESLACIGLFLFQLIVARYLASGMSEASYVFCASIIACGSIWLVRRADSLAEGKEPAPAWQVALVVVVMVCAICFWGMMRPYLLAFVLIPIALLIACELGVSRLARIALVAFSVVAVVATLAGFMYFGTYYVAPYFDGSSIGGSLVQLLISALGNLVGIHVDAVLYTGAAFVKLRWVGIMTAWFAVEWVVLVVMAVRAWKRRARAEFALEVSALLAGFALFEANILLYSPKQLHRTLIAVALIYALIIVFLYRPRSIERRRMAVPAATLAFVALACVGSLAVNPDDFRLPQVDPAFTIAEGDEVSAQLADLMPQGEDPWDNTVAHPIESSNFRLYFCLPAYQSLNCCQGDYLRQALEDGTLKSRYVSLPIGHKLDKVASARYDVVYRGLDHVIYRVR